MCLSTLPPFRITQRCAVAGRREEIFCINLNIVHKNLPFELCRLMRQLMCECQAHEVLSHGIQFTAKHCIL
jgi:hypothetical protein